LTDLAEDERKILNGDAGRGPAFAMRIILAAARAARAPRLREISAAHVDSCLFHGQSSLDFVRRVSEDAARVRVPTTLNVGSLDLRHRNLVRVDARFSRDAQDLMDSYVALGCQPTFTCAPYQLPGRPGYGCHVAWAESNAIAFGNSVLGVRTNRYGDFLDICAALTARVPDAGLHVEANRAARAVFRLDSAVLSMVDPGLLAPLLGHHVGRATGRFVPVVLGLDGLAVDEDWLKAFGAAAASSGAVALFHLVGITPDAPDLVTATHDLPPELERTVYAADLHAARAQLCTVEVSGPLGGVSLGTPHLSPAELVAIADELAGRRVRVPTYVSTSRSGLDSVPAAAAALEASGVQIVVDTCTYITSIMRPAGAVLTDSAKWAYYAPANLGFDVVLASRSECLRSAVSGQIMVDALP
jgi:predicted aconitase